MSAAALLVLACKTGLVAALALAGAALLRSRPARERVALLRLGLLLAAALPLISQQIPALRVAPPAALERLAPSAAAAPAPVPATVRTAPADKAAPAAPVPAAASAAARGLPAISPWMILTGIYAVGVAVLLLRLLAGVLVLVRRTREARPVEDPRWLAALERAVGAGPRPRLLASPRPLSPLSWGVRPGVILVGPEALAQGERADAVLTHELAHIRHGDWLFLILSRLLTAVFWFNPLVWLLQRELARQSEHAADAWAVARVSRLDYAGALVAMARSGRPHAALGMADSELARRVKTVLADRAHRGRPWPTAAAAVACVGLAGPLAAVELAPEVVPPALRPALATPAAPSDMSSPTAAAEPAATAGARIARALTAPAPAQAAAIQTPEDRAAVVRQRDLGLAMMEGGARQLEAAAADLRRKADSQPLSEAERTRMKSEASELDAEAAKLRKEASDLAARDVAGLSPMTPGDERHLAADMARIAAASLPMDLEVRVGADLYPAGEPGPAADVRVALGQGAAATGQGLATSAMGRAADDQAERARRDAARTQAEAERLARDRPPPPGPAG